ncbi:LysR substrate-binding domain-containing protein [Paracoccus sp. FO-3]|uniref:LysR substrate-binding domain-containing protein n=1 Tax=Paracoccus sp. FO-3 TaxID=1335059 RepID=UPI00112AEC01|nr:LysR substrate-binding domain-containing protein [Paracoccus sp. FO-3]
MQCAIEGQGNYRLRRLGAIRFGLYAAPDHVRRHGAPERPEDLHRHPVIGWTEDLAYLAMANWLESRCSGLRPCLRLASFAAQFEAVRKGAGWAVLSDFAARRAGLVPALPGVFRPESELWLLTHGQSGALQRVRRVRDCVAAAIREELAAKSDAGCA